MKTISVAAFAAIVCAFAQPAAAQAGTFKEQVLYSFCTELGCTDGQNPYAGVIDVKGTLYGTTVNGGEEEDTGTVFSINLSTGAETVVHAFTGDRVDGYGPEAGLIDVNGTLYGTTCCGGTFGGGILFALNPNTGAETVLYSFCSRYKRRDCEDGDYPVASLIDVKGKLYGTTEYGGRVKACDINRYGCGTVFSVDRDTGAEKVLYSFTGGTDGAYPTANLINVDGTLYGTTRYSGPSGGGTAFALDPGTGAMTVLHAFGGSTDGFFPVAGLIDVNGLLYGTTEWGGAHGGGTIFSLDPNTDAETVLYSFCPTGFPCADGEVPAASLTYVNGTFYGTTYMGGGTGCDGSGCGTAFAFDANTGAETALYSFCDRQNSDNCPGGVSPSANLIDVGGRLYGTTVYAGHDCANYCDGTVFSLKEKRR